MDRQTIINNNIRALKMGYELAEIANNEFLKNYVKKQLPTLEQNANSTFYTDEDLAETYAIDLVLFIKTSSIINDIDNKDYFKNELITLCEAFPNLKKDEDVSQII